MQPGEITGLPYLSPTHPAQLPPAYFGSTTNDIIPKYQFTQFPENPMNQLNMITPQAQQMSLSSNSTSDEAEEQQWSIINERKRRRMISNRESARRSRMRKQRHLDELLSQVVRLRNENHQVMEKLNNVTESRDRVVLENAQLKEVNFELRQMIIDTKLNSSFPSLTELEDDDLCNDLEKKYK